MGNFKQLRVWQEGINLAANIYHVTSREKFRKDYGLANQIQRAGFRFHQILLKVMKEIRIEKQFIFLIYQKVLQLK